MLESILEYVICGSLVFAIVVCVGAMEAPNTFERTKLQYYVLLFLLSTLACYIVDTLHKNIGGNL